MQKRAREKGFILALDEGTSSAKAYIIDHNGFIISSASYEFTHYFPRPGWVEHDAEEIWHAQQHAALTAIKTAGIAIDQIVAIGVTNQRETTVLWDKKTGKPVYHAIVWQDRRTSEMVKNLSVDCKLEIKEKTGLIPDSYFSALKIKWMFDNIPKLKEKAKNGTVLFGTIDTFLIYKLTQGALHMTDHSNASRTMLFNSHTLLWDEELLELFGIPDCVLPELKSSSDLYGVTDKKHFLCEIPISGCIGDQQAALFGHTAFTPGITKNTYGTGNFVLMNTGDKFIRSKSLLSTVAWSIGTKITYALEGSVFGTGAGIQWVKDQLRYTDDFQKMESLAATLTSNEGVYFVPAFVGLGAPHWDPYARGTIVGMTLGTNNAHLVRAALEAPVYLSQDIIDVIEKDSGIKIKELRVDGGASINNFMMQFQADISNRRVIRPHQRSTTALGAAFVAGLAVGFWKNLNELSKRWKEGTVFEPIMNEHTRTLLMKGWKKALQSAQHRTRD